MRLFVRFQWTAWFAVDRWRGFYGEEIVMQSSTRFTRSCPTCGRLLDIPVEQIGRRIRCSHCQAEFSATLPSQRGAEKIEINLDERIDRLLAETAVSPPRHHFDHSALAAERNYEV